MVLDRASILVTGGCGQVGMAIVEHLREHNPNAKIAVLDLAKPGPDHAQSVNNVTYFAGDITNEVSVREVLEAVKPLVVFHTAGLIPQIAKRLNMNSEWGYTAVNVQGTRNVLDAAKAVGSVKAFVLTSSCDVVKGNSWQDLVNVNESMPIPTEFGDHYAKSKVSSSAFLFRCYRCLEVYTIIL
jgi:sterol-4alpha-carboxylate 3-dehydrogenase (decarboxylating)